MRNLKIKTVISSAILTAFATLTPVVASAQNNSMQNASNLTFDQTETEGFWTCPPWWVGGDAAGCDKH